MTGVTGQVTAEADPRSVPHESQAKICAVPPTLSYTHQQLRRTTDFRPLAGISPHFRTSGAVPARRRWMTSSTESLWRATCHLRRFTPLSRDLDVDLAILGGGIT